MKITISGYPGSGKSVLRQMLSEEYGIPGFSVGDLRGEYAKSLGITLEQLNELGKTDSTTDTNADEYQTEWAKQKTSFVLEGRLSYHFIKDSIKIFLSVHPDIGAMRILLNPRDDETKCTLLEEKVRLNIERCKSDRERYFKHYQIKDCYDQKQFDIVIDTSDKNPEQVLYLAKTRIRVIQKQRAENPQK